ncbi:MAG: aconitase X catalytic domain-containing protein [Candidatus Methanofastidiosia archaeon]
MYLSRRDEKTLEGEFGKGNQKAMEILLALGEIYGADRLIEIKSAQLSGVSYKTMGEYGLEFLEEFSRECKVKIKTFLNPCGMDRVRWREMGIDEEFAKKQRRLINAYLQMGVEPTLTCTPYYFYEPEFKEHLAWAESSAVIYVNSIFGARTNREAGPSALAAAVIGKTPNYGLHLKENRKAQILVEVKTKLKGSDFGALGYLVGREIGSKIPYFKGFRAKKDELKALGAALAASGAVPMFHLERTTPEWRKAISDVEVLKIERDEIESVYRELNTASDAELIALGCPHCSLKEIKKIAEILDERKNFEKELWVCTSKFIHEKAKELGYVDIIERFGVVLCDTCMVVSPIEGKFKSTGVNSGKAACYLPSFSKQKVVFGEIKKLLGEKI